MCIRDSNYESRYSDEVSATPIFSGTTIYVDNSPSAEPSNPDGSENNAFYTIQDALESISSEGIQILVKPGTYTEHQNHPVVEFIGRNVVIESVAGPATTIIDGEGDRTAIRMNSSYGSYGGGYSSSTKIIGFTIKNGDDDSPLVDITGPYYETNTPSAARVPWKPVFENCRFTNSTTSRSLYYEAVSPISIFRASPTFDGCTFRALKVTNDAGVERDYVEFPAAITLSNAQSGTIPNIIAYFVSI
mgnify:CR=1 FL=1